MGGIGISDASDKQQQQQQQRSSKRGSGGSGGRSGSINAGGDSGDLSGAPGSRRISRSRSPTRRHRIDGRGHQRRSSTGTRLNAEIAAGGGIEKIGDAIKKTGGVTETIDGGTETFASLIKNFEGETGKVPGGGAAEAGGRKGKGRHRRNGSTHSVDSLPSKGGNGGSGTNLSLALTPTSAISTSRLSDSATATTAAAATATGPAEAGGDKEGRGGEAKEGHLSTLRIVDQGQDSAWKTTVKEDPRYPPGVLPAAAFEGPNDLELSLGSKGGARDGPAPLGARRGEDMEGMRGDAPDLTSAAGGRRAVLPMRGHVRRWSKGSKASGRR